MSTVDLTKVAGFKAVDAEGNDMGVVSLSEMTNMVKESIIQEAVAMQSVSTLAEASTLAATDTYEDQLPTSDTFSYVRTLDSSGNPKRTSSNAFASVVGGLLEYDKGLPYRGKQTFSDFNDAGNGIWLIFDGISLENSPLPNGYGILVCYVANKFVVQELYNYNTNREWRRHRSDYGEWTDWKEL